MLHSGPTLPFAFLFARSDIKPAIKLPEAGVTTDPELSFDYHFSCLTNPIVLVLWETGKIRPNLLQEDVVLLIHFSVMFLLGHWNVGLLTFHVRAHLQSCSWHSNCNILFHCLEALHVALQHVGIILRCH